MERLLIELIKRQKQLNEAISATEELLKGAPEGKLRIDNNKGNAKFFQVLSKYSSGTYIPQEERMLADKLAEKGLAEKLLVHAKRELASINRYISFLKEESADHVYRKLSEERKKLVTPIMLDGDTYASMWISKPFPKNPQFPEGLTFKTKRGDMVRSKSEVFIANVYYELGIPYKYECPIVLENGSVRYPDFTLLDIARHRVVYHEHLGLLDDAEYRRAAILKLREYRQNGIYTGKNLILTSETAYAPFDPEQFRRRIRDSFQVELLKQVRK
jgi:hypothetical protein